MTGLPVGDGGWPSERSLLIFVAGSNLIATTNLWLEGWGCATARNQNTTNFALCLGVKSRLN